MVIGNSFIQTPMTYPDSFPTLLVSKMKYGVDSYRVGGYGPMTTIVQSLFSSPEKMLSGKKVVILGIGVQHLLANIAFNNIREMDQMSLMLSEKSLIESFSVENPVSVKSGQFSKLEAVTLFQLPADGKTTVFEKKITNYTHEKEVIVIIPACRIASTDVSLKINGNLIEIPCSYPVVRIINVGCKLPAGTDRIKIEAVGSPGTVFGIRNIAIYQ